MDTNNKQRKPSLTTFNFQLPEDDTNEEGVLAKIFDKVISAVSGQPHIQDNTSVRTYASSINTPKDNRQSVISTNVSLHNSQGKSETGSIYFCFYMTLYTHCSFIRLDRQYTNGTFTNDTTATASTTNVS